MGCPRYITLGFSIVLGDETMDLQTTSDTMLNAVMKLLLKNDTDPFPEWITEDLATLKLAMDPPTDITTPEKRALTESALILAGQTGTRLPQLLARFPTKGSPIMQRSRDRTTDALKAFKSTNDLAKIIAYMKKIAVGVPTSMKEAIEWGTKYFVSKNLPLCLSSYAIGQTNQEFNSKNCSIFEDTWSTYKQELVHLADSIYPSAFFVWTKLFSKDNFAALQFEDATLNLSSRFASIDRPNLICWGLRW